MAALAGCHGGHPVLIRRLELGILAAHTPILGEVLVAMQSSRDEGPGLHHGGGAPPPTGPLNLQRPGRPAGQGPGQASPGLSFSPGSVDGACSPTQLGMYIYSCAGVCAARRWRCRAVVNDGLFFKNGPRITRTVIVISPVSFRITRPSRKLEKALPRRRGPKPSSFINASRPSASSTSGQPGGPGEAIAKRRPGRDLRLHARFSLSSAAPAGTLAPAAEARPGSLPGTTAVLLPWQG